jgi:hypothetical protein
MAFGTNVARAKQRGHDIKRKLFLGADATLRLLKGDGTILATLTNGWNLGRKEYTEIEDGSRYFKLYVDDLDGTRLPHLKAMVTVRIKGINFKFIGKDSSLAIRGTIPSYEFKVQAIGEQLA